MDAVYKNSPYEAFAGNPIIYSDPSGLDTIRFNKNSTIVTNPDGHVSGGSTFGINITADKGKDVYIYNNTVTTIDRSGKSTTNTTSTILHPEDHQSASGVTKGLNLYLDGLITTERNNYDWEAIGKIMDIDPDFSKYMLGRNSQAAIWNERTGDYELMEGLMPALVKAGFGSFIGFSLGASMDAFTVNSSKFDYFFGRVVTGPQHNIERSAQNLKDLTTLGITDEGQLMGVFRQAYKGGTVLSTKASQYGTTVIKSVNVGSQGSVEVGFFYEGGNMNAKPSVSTIIPKIFNQ